MSQPNPIDDLTATAMVQNNMLLALIRAHSNRDVLATTYQQSLQRFPDAIEIATKSPDLFPLTSATLKAFEKALVTPL